VLFAALFWPEEQNEDRPAGKHCVRLLRYVFLVSSSESADWRGKIRHVKLVPTFYTNLVEAPPKRVCRKSTGKSDNRQAGGGDCT
jgi:hypothetical protein